MSAERRRSVEADGGPGELSLLFEISQILDSSLDLRTVVEPVLEAITRSLGMKFATLTLLNRQTGEIAIEAAYGLSASQKRKGPLQAGGRNHREGHPDRASLPSSRRYPRSRSSWTGRGRGERTRRGSLLPLRAHQAGQGGRGRPERGPAASAASPTSRRRRGSSPSSPP